METTRNMEVTNDVVTQATQILKHRQSRIYSFDAYMGDILGVCLNYLFILLHGAMKEWYMLNHNLRILISC